MIDVKKLITGFLILASAATVTGIILSFVSGFSATAQTPTEAQISGAAFDATSSPIANNAFVDTGSLQGNAAEVLNDTISTTTQAVAGDPENLTNTFAETFLNGLVAANPNGVATDQSGTPQFNPPDTTAIATAISADPVLQDFTAPNWAAEASAQAIKSTGASSDAAVTQYSNSLNAIFNKYFVATNLKDAVNNPTADPTDLSYISSKVQGALSDTLALQTPASLVNFQKSLVKVLVYEKDATSLGQIANTDPVKASLILESEQSQFTSAVASLQAQMHAASSVGLLFGAQEPTASVPFIAQLFGIQPAHAIFGIGDITFDPATFGELVLTYVNDSVVQILKNTLVSLIQQKVLTWIQGSGAPRFVTNWGEELVNSFQTAAINKLNSAIACVPSYQAPILKILLSTPAVGASGINSCAAEFNGQLNNNLGNLSRLYNNFTNFNDYFAVMGPTGNTWANLITIHDSALAAGSNGQAANTSQNIASQGFKGSQVCTDGSDPVNGTHTWCDGGGNPQTVEVCSDNSTPDENGTCDNGFAAQAKLQCSNGSAPEIDPNGGKCADGTDPKTTSPGAVTGQSMLSVLQGGIQNITSANSIVGILNALLSSLLNTLSQNAINYSTQAINGATSGSGSHPSDSGLTGISPSKIGGTTSTSTATAVQCLPSIQNALISTSTGQAAVNLSAGGGTIDSTCVINNNCPATENQDGSPIYNWSAPGSLQAASGTLISGSSLSLTYTTPGQYFAVVTGSTDNTTSSCEIDVQ